MDTNDYSIEFIAVSYAATGRAILSSLDLKVRRGELMVLLGRSGSGKTTALKLVNRLLDPAQGQVRVEGRATLDWDPIRLRRRIGYAIQEIGLFPHCTVEQNIALLPTLEKWPSGRASLRVKELLKLVGLAEDDFSRRYPDELSGGQRQRVGLARALALDPTMLLMDEPFGALDPLTRAEVQHEFKRLSTSLGKTVLFVTHDTHEALVLADRIAILDDGTLRGVFTPQEFINSSDVVVQPYLRTMQMPTDTERL